MLVQLYSGYSKRVNSTRVPESVGTIVNVQLKEGTSVVRPVFLCNLKETAPAIDPCTVNYVYAPGFGGRYYWVEDLTALPGSVWAISCRVDVLATYRGSIGNLSAYVLRSSAEFNGRVFDEAYPLIATRVTASRSLSSPPFASRYQDGVYVVGIVTGDAGTNGGLQYFIFTHDNFSIFVGKLLNTIDWVDISTDEIGEGLQKALFDPTQYIRFCSWLPVTYAAFNAAEAVTSLRYGWWEIDGIDARILPTSEYIKESRLSADLIEHPEAASRGVYFNCAPYREISLTYPPFCRDFSLPAEVFTEIKTLGLQIRLDVTTGEAVLDLSQSVLGVFQSFRANVAVPVPIHTARQDIVGAASHVVNALSSAGGTIGSALTLDFGDAFSSLGGAVSSIGSAVNSFTPSLAVVSGSGSNTFLDITEAPHLHHAFAYTTTENVDLFGRPLCSTRTLSTIPGFIKCAYTPFTAPGATAQEISEVEGYLVGGIYYE